MPDADFISRNSMFIENLMQHGFLYEIARVFALESPARKVAILNGEVDDEGVDVVLTLGGKSRHIQLKTVALRNKDEKPSRNDYSISASLLQIEGACIVWILYDRETLNICGYIFYGGKIGSRMPGISKIAKRNKVTAGGKVKQRAGYLLLNLKQGTYAESATKLATLLFEKAP